MLGTLAALPCFSRLWSPLNADWATQDEAAYDVYPGTMSDIYSYAKPDCKVVLGCYCKTANTGEGCWSWAMRCLRKPWTCYISLAKLDDPNFPETDKPGVFTSPFELERARVKVGNRPSRACMHGWVGGWMGTKGHRPMQTDAPAGTSPLPFFLCGFTVPQSRRFRVHGHH